MLWPGDANSRPLACGIVSRSTTSRGRRIPSRDARRCRTGRRSCAPWQLLPWPCRCVPKAACRMRPVPCRSVQRLRQQVAEAPRPGSQTAPTSTRNKLPTVRVFSAGGRASAERSKWIAALVFALSRTASSSTGTVRAAEISSVLLIAAKGAPVAAAKRAGENCARRSNVTIASARVPRPPGLAAAGSTNCHTVSIPLPSNCISVPPGKPNTFMSKGIGAAPPVDRHRRLRGLFGLPGSFAVAGSYAPPEVDSGSLNAPRPVPWRPAAARCAPSADRSAR